MKRSAFKVLAPIAVLATVGTAQVVAAGTTEPPGTTEAAAEAPSGDSKLDQVIAADVVKCGVRVDLPGFNSVDEAGEQVGFDADFCRVIAAAVLGDSTKVEFVNIESGDARFPALQSGEIDVLVRNTTWTASRDGTEGATFLHPIFYDGQGMMVAADSYASIDEMDGTTICVVAGTTTEGNVATEFAARGLTANVKSFEDIGLLQEDWVAGGCDGWSSDTSQLNAVRASFPDADGGPDSLVILDEVFSKEPLAPAVLDGDSRWADAVNWAIFATIQAEEFGVTSENAADMAAGDDPQIAAFLGAPNADGTVVDPGLGLAPDFALQVVSQVGNYGEIFDRTLTQTIGIERGINALWTDGGLQYAPPYR
jgi:general L-amino acid transport system substrate-binding protein